MNSIRTWTRSSRRTGGGGGGQSRQSATIDTSGDEVIVALIHNKAFDVGIAWCSLRTLTLHLTQLADTMNFAKTLAHLSAIRPVEVCIPHTVATGPLSSALEAHVPDVGISSIHRKFFNDTKGTHIIAELSSSSTSVGKAGVESSLLDVLQPGHYLSVAAAAALVQYVQFTQKYKFIPSTVRVSYHKPARYVEIDHATVSVLGLVQPTQQWFHRATKVQGSVSMFDAINRTTTPMGNRLLLSNLLQPIRDEPTLTARLDAIELLTKDEKLFTFVREALRCFADVDVERVLACYSHDATGSRSMRVILALIQSVNHTQSIIQNLKRFHNAPAADQSSLLQAIFSSLNVDQFKDLGDTIAEVVDPAVADAVEPNCFLIRAGVNAVLDVARQRYSDSIDQMVALCDDLRQRVPSLKLKTTTDRHTTFQFLATHQHLASPGEFLEQHRTGNVVRGTTRELESLASAHKDAWYEVLKCEDVILLELVSQVRLSIGGLQVVAESIGLLDLLMSHATFAISRSDMIRPSLSKANPTCIVGGQHPTVPEKTHQPNDVPFAEDCMLMILTGPNASGKSTYLKQVAQLIVLAHTGSFIPAVKANIYLIDRVLARFSAEDEADTNASSFMREMRELSRLLQCVTPRSLLLCDELARGTSHVEGVALSWAVVEWVADLRCHAIFATHFSQLSRLAQVVPSVDALHCSVQLRADQVSRRTFLQFLHRVLKGACQVNRYGLEIAKRVGFPEDILEGALRKASQQTKANAKSLSTTQHALLSLQQKIESCPVGMPASEKLKLLCQ